MPNEFLIPSCTQQRMGRRQEGCEGCLPEVVPPAEFPAQFVVEAPAHLAQPAAAQVAAEAVFVPVLVDGLQEIAVPDVLLAPPTCQQRRGDLQHLIHGLPVGMRQLLDPGKPTPRASTQEEGKAKPVTRLDKLPQGGRPRFCSFSPRLRKAPKGFFTFRWEMEMWRPSLMV